MLEIVEIKNNGKAVAPKTHVKAVDGLVINTSPLIDLGNNLSFHIKNFLSNYTINFYGVISSAPNGRTIFENVIHSDYRPRENLLVQAHFLLGDSIPKDFDLSLLILTTGDIHMISSGVPSSIELGFNISWIG